MVSWGISWSTTDEREEDRHSSTVDHETSVKHGRRFHLPVSSVILFSRDYPSCQGMFVKCFTLCRENVFQLALRASPPVHKLGGWLGIARASTVYHEIGVTHGRIFICH